jgi:hypothetical protein
VRRPRVRSTPRLGAFGAIQIMMPSQFVDFESKFDVIRIII